MSILKITGEAVIASSLSEIDVITGGNDQVSIAVLKDTPAGTATDKQFLQYSTGDGRWNYVDDVDVIGSIKNNKYTLPGFFANPSPAFNPQNIPGITSLCGEGFASINIWKRESALQPGSTGYLGMYYDTYTNPTPDDWKGRGPYLSMPIADKRSIFNLAAFRSRISPDVNPTLDVDGNLDSYTGEFQVETYNKVAGNDTAQFKQTFSTSSRGVVFRFDDRGTGSITRTDIYTDNNQTTVETDASNGLKLANDRLQIDASQVDFTNLPTSDPGVSGRLWNDAGTLKISP